MKPHSCSGFAICFDGHRPLFLIIVHDNYLEVSFMETQRGDDYLRLEVSLCCRETQLEPMHGSINVELKETL
jgi:hypothetical protein